MFRYFVARNDGGAHFSSITDTELLLRTEHGIYRVSPKTEKQPVNFLHIGNRLGDPNTPLEEIGKKLLTIPNHYGKERTGIYAIEPLQTKLGCKIGRVRRPVFGWGIANAFQDTSQTTRIYADRVRQSVHLHEKLLKFGNFVDLTQSNLAVYGFETRDLLLIACLEVEALFKILMFEQFQTEKGNIADYWRISGPAKLSDYELRFSEIPNIPPLRPFASWGGKGANSYSPLRWYSAYNQTKHGAIGGSKAATLECALEALAACFVLLSAYAVAPQQHSTLTRRQKESFEEAFIFDSRPCWSPGESYWVLPGKPLCFTATP